MTDKRGDYHDFQDRIFQELQDLENHETQLRNERNELQSKLEQVQSELKQLQSENEQRLIRFGKLRGLTEQEVCDLRDAHLHKPDMTPLNFLRILDAEGKKKKESSTHL